MYLVRGLYPGKQTQCVLDKWQGSCGVHFLLDFSMYVFLASNGQSIPVFGRCPYVKRHKKCQYSEGRIFTTTAVQAPKAIRWSLFPMRQKHCSCRALVLLCFRINLFLAQSDPVHVFWGLLCFLLCHLSCSFHFFLGC